MTTVVPVMTRSLLFRARSHHSHTSQDEWRLLAAFVLTAAFMGVEILGGILSGSLALIADAGHMLTDAAALGLGWIAARMARRPASPRRSYGHHRLEVLAAFVNGATLIGIAAWIAIEAVRRFFNPVEVLGGVMMTIAALGLVVNLAALFILSSGSGENLNLRAALLHVVGDLFGSVAAIAAAGVILLTGWLPVDPLLSMVVALLIVRSAWGITTEAGQVLMEGTPAGFDVDELKRELVGAVAGVLDIHHVHVWALTPERPLITLHATLAEAADHEVALRALQAALSEQFGLEHATIQLERVVRRRPGTPEAHTHARRCHSTRGPGRASVDALRSSSQP